MGAGPRARQERPEGEQGQRARPEREPRAEALERSRRQHRPDAHRQREHDRSEGGSAGEVATGPEAEVGDEAGRQQHERRRAEDADGGAAARVAPKGQQRHQRAGEQDGAEREHARRAAAELEAEIDGDRGRHREREQRSPLGPLGTHAGPDRVPLRVFAHLTGARTA